MKPWLFDILACPICKHYPLNLFIFTYESDEDFFKNLLDKYIKTDIKYHIKEKIPEWTKEDDQIYIRDNIVIEKIRIDDYIKFIISSVEEFDFISDNSSFNLSKECIDMVKTKIKEKILQFRDYSNLNEIEKILPELNFLNRIKIEIEIKTGLILCNNCNRWYPIKDSIPRMLPDEYREKEKDIQFLKENQEFLDKEILNRNLKPFNL